MVQRIVRIWCCRSLSPKTILILSKNFLDLYFDEIEKQDIINLSRNGGKGHASVVRDDSEVTFLSEERGCSFLSISLLCSGYIRRCSIKIVSYQISLSSILLWIFHRYQKFLFLIFISTPLRSWVNCPSLMSSWLVAFVRGLSVTFREFLSRFLKCSFRICIHSSWLAAFSFALKVVFSFTHFIYCLPCQSYLSIFYQFSYFIDLTLNVFFLFFLVCIN